MSHYNKSINKPGMSLRKIEIEIVTYGEKKGTYEGEITFDSPTGSVGLCLNDEQCAKMFAVVADGVIETAKEVALILVEEARATLANSSHPVIA